MARQAAIPGADVHRGRDGCRPPHPAVAGSLGGDRLRRPRRSATWATHVVVGGPSPWTGKGSGVEVNDQVAYVWTVSRRQGHSGSRVSRPCRGPRSRRAVGVGDVAGERGAAHQRYDAFNRRDLDAVLALMDADVEYVSAWSPSRAATTATTESAAGGEPARHLPRLHHRGIEVRDLGNLTIATLRNSAHSGGSAVAVEQTHWGVARVARQRSSSGAAATGPKPKPSKPSGCGSRRCRRRTWRS